MRGADPIARAPRLLLVHGSAARGGAELQTIRLARWLRERRVEVFSLFQCDGGPMLDAYRHEGFTVFHEPSLGWPRTALRDWLTSVDPGAAYVFGMKPNVWWRVIGRRVCPRTRLWTAVRGLRDSQGRAWPRMLADRLTSQWVDGYVCNSHYTIATLARAGVPERKLRFLRNMSAIEPLPRATAPLEIRSVTATDASIVLPSPVPVITCVANVRPVKGHPLLVRALERLAADGADFRCVLVGDLTASASSVQADVRAAGLEDRVIFAGFRDDVHEILRRSDVFVFPSLMEGCPNAVLDAMRAELPVVTSPWGDQGRLIHDGCGGYVLDPHDAGAFAARLEQLLADQPRRQQYGRYNLEVLRREFDPSLVDREHRAVMQEMLGTELPASASVVASGRAQDDA